MKHKRSKLWAHCVGRHAAILSPETSMSELKDCHAHEHQGSCAIRNHEEDDLSYSLKRVGEVLSENED